MLASDEDSAARLQDLRELPLAGHQALVSSVAFSPDGRVLATGSWDRTVRLWDVTDPDRPRLLGVPLTGQASMIRTVAFSPDGRRLIAGSADGTAILTDITNPASPRELATFSQSMAIDTVAFAPDGHTVATGGNDRTARLWATDIDQVTARICQVAHPRLTPDDWNRYFPGLPYQPPCA